MAEEMYKRMPDGTFEPVETVEPPREPCHIKTPSGFEYDIDPAVMDDFLIVEDLAAVDAGETLRIFPVIKKLLGEDGKQALYNHLLTKDGRVPVKALADELAEIFKALGNTGKK